MRPILLFCLASALSAQDFRFYQPRNIRPEHMESEIQRMVPNARVGSFPSQSGILIGGDESTMEQVNRIIDLLDRPGQVVELEIGMGGFNDTSDAVTGVAGTVSRGDEGQEPVPSEFRRVRGRSYDRGGQTLLCMPGKPAELFIGETQFRDAGILNPPIEVQAGRRIMVDNLRIIDNGAEFDIAIENTVPGSGPVVSSGTRLRTSVRIALGETAYVSTNDTDSDNEGSVFDGDYDRNGGFGRFRSTKRRGISAGNISVTLKRIR